MSWHDYHLKFQFFMQIFNLIWMFLVFDFFLKSQKSAIFMTDPTTSSEYFLNSNFLHDSKNLN